MSTAPHPLPTDPEVLAYIDGSNRFYPSNWQTLSLEENRSYYSRYAETMRAPSPECVHTLDTVVQASNPLRSVVARWYRNSNRTQPSPATVLYIHGGGFVLGGLESHADVCLGLCEKTGLDVFASTYRLAPEHHHPAQIDDVQASLDHLLMAGHKVILAGDSAGGNLAAALALRNRSSAMAHQILGQVLIYPGLGGDSTAGSYVSNAHAPMLTTEDSLYYFSVRTGAEEREKCNDPDLMPLKAVSFMNLPPAFVVTADLDPLRDDGPEYVRRLVNAGVKAMYRNEPELVHGYLRARHMSKRAAASFEAICAAIREMALGFFCRG